MGAYQNVCEQSGYRSYGEKSTNQNDFKFLSEVVRCGASQKKDFTLSNNEKIEFKQMVARLAKIPKAGEYLIVFPCLGD